MAGVDPDLVRRWLAGRSRSRGVAAPVADSGGWRVDTNGEAEQRRYVFAEPGPGLTRLATTIIEPRVFLKLCADADTLRGLLPARWSITDANCMMVSEAEPQSLTLSSGYALHTDQRAGVTHVVITGPEDDEAASGYAAEHDGVFVYDRIVTAESHRRRGLGRALMAALGAARHDPASRQVLVATAMGAALYASLGWQTYCSYTTAAIDRP